MKRMLPLFCVFCLVHLSSQTVFGQSEWITYTSEAPLEFSVYVPGEMKKSNKTIQTAVGELETMTFEFQGDEDDVNYLYLINLVQYPFGTFHSDSTALMSDYLDNSIQTTVDKVGGTLVYSSDIDYENGKLFRIKYNNGDAVIKGKSFIRNDVFVNVQVFTIQNKSLNDEMDVFLDSFKMKF